MPKIIKEPVYKKVLVCENCGQHWSMDETYPQYKAKICTCCVCKKEGCGCCATWSQPTGKKYPYHFKCKEGLPKSVSKAIEILFEIDQLRIKYKGQKIDIEEGSKYINEALEILTTWKEDICKKQLDDLFTGELKCKCKDEDKHGWTLFYLCHHCGREYKFKEVPLNQLKNK